MTGVKFSDCMRANGVSSFPDRDASGESFGRGTPPADWHLHASDSVKARKAHAKVGTVIPRLAGLLEWEWREPMSGDPFNW